MPSSSSRCPSVRVAPGATAALAFFGLTLCQITHAAPRAPRPAPRAAAGTRYALTIITPARKNPPFIPGDTRIKGINNVGQVIGWSSVGTNTFGGAIFHAFRFEGGKLIDLGAPGGTGAQSLATGISDAGRVVGSYITPTSDVFGYFTGANGGISAGNTLDNALPFGLNNRDEFVGQDLVTGQGLLSSPLVGTHNITLGVTSTMFAISNPAPGQPLRVAGTSTDENSVSRGVLWTDANGNGTVEAGEVVLLQPFDPAGDTTALGVNNQGQVVGQSDHPSGAHHALLYPGPNNQVLDLGTLPTNQISADSNAVAINDNGQIVGSSVNSAVIWEKDGNGVYQIHDLNQAIVDGDPTFAAQLANGINSSGQIVGEGVQAGVTVGFLLTPIPPPPAADLSVTQSLTPATVKVTQPLTYTITATNSGPNSAASVVVTDTLPAGLPSATLKTVAGSASTSGGVVTWNVGTLASGQSATLTITGTPTAAAPLTNSAAITGTVTDNNSANDTSTLTTPVVNLAADLALTLTPAGSTAIIGQNFTYTLKVSNNGPDTAAAVVVTANVPGSASFVSATPTATPSGGTVTFNAGQITSGGSFTATLVVKPADLSTLQETASVTGSTIDADTSNNQASATTTVTPVPADLFVSVSADAAAGQVDHNLTYTLNVGNRGPNAGTGVVVTANVPDGSTFVSAAPNATVNGNTVTFNVGNVALGAPTALTLVVTPTAAGTLLETASVTGATSDPALANNTASLSLPVSVDPPLPSDLTGQWGSTVHPVIQGKGKTAFYTLSTSFTVKNLGAGGAQAFKVRFLVSKNTLLDAKDETIPVTDNGQPALLELAVPGLDAGGSLTLGPDSFSAFHFTAKQLKKIKGKILIAVVDFGNAVAETNEANNNIASPKVK